MSLFHASILTIFPAMFPGPLQFSLAGQALTQNIWSYDIINIRDFGLTKHKNVDDQAYGGSGGLVMRPDVLGLAIDQAAAKNPGSKIYYLSPRGQLLNQQIVRQIILDPAIIILCGRFEGVDERVIEEYQAIEISVGDYILSGGECAALILLDCAVRLLPGVIANQAVLQAESLESGGELMGQLEYPLYTRPAQWRGRVVPDILLSGHHSMINQWRQQQSTLITRNRRPDLLKLDITDK